MSTRTVSPRLPRAAESWESHTLLRSGMLDSCELAASTMPLRPRITAPAPLLGAAHPMGPWQHNSLLPPWPRQAPSMDLGFDLSLAPMPTLQCFSLPLMHRLAGAPALGSTDAGLPDVAAWLPRSSMSS